MPAGSGRLIGSSQETQSSGDDVQVGSGSGGGLWCDVCGSVQIRLQRRGFGAAAVLFDSTGRAVFDQPPAVKEGLMSEPSSWRGLLPLCNLHSFTAIERQFDDERQPYWITA